MERMLLTLDDRKYFRSLCAIDLLGPVNALQFIEGNLPGPLLPVFGILSAKPRHAF